jgi:hypothetical protein
MTVSAGLRFPQVLTPSDFAFATSPDYDALIGQNAATTLWFVPSADKVTLTTVSSVPNNVTAAVDRAAARALTGGLAPNGPIWTSSLINSRPALNYATATPRRYMTSATAIPTAHDFSGVIVLTLNANATTTPRYIAMAGASRAFRLDVLSTTGQERFEAAVQEGANQARALTPALSALNSVAATYVVMWAWNNTTKTMYLTIDGGITWYSGVNASVTNGPDAASLQLGTQTSGAGAQDGQQASVWIGNVNLFDPANATLLASLRNYVYDRYGLLSPV